MWYSDILQNQARKICKSNKEKAEQFITQLIYLLEQADFEFEWIAVLGFIKDLYLFGEQNKYRDVPLAEFARESLGLLILHMKYIDDYVVRISDFIPLCKDKIILLALDIEELVSKLQTDFYNKIGLNNKSVSEKFPVTISNKVILKVLLWIEREVFLRLHYKVSVDVEELTTIFHRLITEVNEPFQLLSELSFFLDALENQNKEFDRFIFEIRMIEVNLLPPVLNEISFELEQYLQNTPKSCFNSVFFCHSTHATHIKEVTDIVEKIRHNELTNVDSILEKLYEIELVHPKDRLIDTIQSLEDKYRSVVCQF